MTVFKNRLMKNSSIIATLLLIILIATASFLSGRKIYSMERQRNLELLHNEAEDLVLQIENQAKGDREQLLMLATVAADFHLGKWRLLSWETENSKHSRCSYTLHFDASKHSRCPYTPTWQAGHGGTHFAYLPLC